MSRQRSRPALADGARSAQSASVDLRRRIGNRISAHHCCRRAKQNRVVWIVAAALALLTAVFSPSAYRYFRATPESPAVRFSVSLPGTAVGIGGTPVAVSPDGRWIANARAGANNGGIYLLPLGSVTPKFLFE